MNYCSNRGDGLASQGLAALHRAAAQGTVASSVSFGRGDRPRDGAAPPMH